MSETGFLVVQICPLLMSDPVLFTFIHSLRLTNQVRRMTGLTGAWTAPWAARALAAPSAVVDAGAGVNAENASLLLQSSKVNALHLSGKTTRDSLMNRTSEAKMGNQNIDDYLIPVTNSEKISAVKTVILNHI